MRFRTIVLIFNIVIVVSFLFIFLVPLILLGPSYFSIFMSRNWIAGVLFVGALAAVNGYFALNWKLFTLLEKEDWPSLVQFLESEVYRKGRVRAKHVRLLVNAYLITSNAEAARKLESEVRRVRPALVSRLALQFGIPYLLTAGSDEAERYFAQSAADSRAPDRRWLRWNHAFCLCRRGEREGARSELEGILDGTPEPVLRLLSLYLLDTACGGDGEAPERAKKGREEMRERYTPQKWKSVVERARSNLEVVVLSRVIEDAELWLFGGSQPVDESPKLH